MEGLLILSSLLAVGAVDESQSAETSSKSMGVGFFTHKRCGFNLEGTY